MKKKKERKRERERERERVLTCKPPRRSTTRVFCFSVPRRRHRSTRACTSNTQTHTHTPRTEENDWLRSHPVSAFGCVVCNDNINNNNNNIHHETKREDEGEKRPMRRTETADSLGFSSFLIGAALSPPEAPPEAPPDLPGLQTTMLSRPSDFFSTEAA